MSEIQLKKKSRKVGYTRRPHRTLLRLMYSCALCIGETLALPPADIKSKEGLIYIREGKGSKHRRVPRSSRLWTGVRKYYKVNQPGQYLLEGQNRYGNMNIKGKTMAQYLPNENDIGMIYAYII